MNDNEKPTASSPTCTALLCCPFCGGIAGTYDAYCTHRNKKTGVQVCCGECNIGTIYKDLTETEAINAWNTRAS